MMNLKDEILFRRSNKIIYAVSHVQASGSIMYYEIAYPKWYIQSAIL